TLRLRSVSSASSLISGTMRRARLISSSGVGMAKRRIAAVFIRENPFVFVPYRPPKMRLGEYRDNAKIPAGAESGTGCGMLLVATRTERLTSHDDRSPSHDSHRCYPRRRNARGQA